ncbi:NYN domain-containing protein [Irpex lacteus]|nr:NYN domain-containing protein [Irpex lacteus]
MEHDSISTVAVFWDYENCEVPATVDGFVVANGIRRLAHKYGSVKTFRAYSSMPEASSLRTTNVRSDLQACGVSIIDCPHNGRKDTVDKMMMVDMLAFGTDNTAPSTILLISGDGDFLYAVSTLRLRKYDIILLAPSQCSHLGLKAQATAVYEWPRDVLSVELPEPSSAPLSGSVLMTPVTAHTRGLPPTGRHYGAPQSVDFSRTGPPYATAAGNSRAASQPNTPQAVTPVRLPLTRPRASSASQQQHNRSTSMPVVPQVATNYSLSVPRLQTAQIGNYSDVAQRQGRTELSWPPVGKVVERPLLSPWRQGRAIMPAPSSSSTAESLSPLTPAINVDTPHDLASYEEEIEENDEESVQVIEESSSQASTSRGNTPVSGAYLTPAEDGLSQVYDRPPMQLPTEPSQDAEQFLDTSTASLESDGTAGPEQEIPPGFHWELVPDGIVVPQVEMYRTRDIFPAYFRPLVSALEEERLRGNTRMISSQLGGKLKQMDGKLYQKAGVQKLSEFIKVARDRGFIITGDLGGTMASNGNVWVALHPNYHGKPPPPPGTVPTTTTAPLASTSYLQAV